MKWYCLLVLVLYPACASHAQMERNKIVLSSINAPGQVETGKTFDLLVMFTISGDWYIYAPTGANAAQGMTETQVVFTLPPGLSKAGKIHLPQPVYKDGHEVYKGREITLIQPMQILVSAKPGSYSIKSTVTWQACSSRICLPPVTEEITTTIHVY